LQDPATLIAAELLDPQPAETVLDLCAAPGGKSLLLADLLEARARQNGAGASAVPDAGSAKAGRVVAVDQPDLRRIARLKENLAKVHVTGVTLVQADVRKLTPALLGQQGLPAAYSAILLDAPCSNTGVMRHRVDVKWRLRETDIAQHAAQQLALLTAAARLLAPGGRLVYSTCSLEPEENEGVVEAFLQTGGGRLSVEQLRHSRPWETGCDGAAAFLLRKNA
jgi:16S rRNA (cytosine967-C5)-methyltransferase